MNRIGGNVCIWSTEGDLDYDKIVDVLKIVSNEFLSMFRRTILDDQVSGSTNSYLVSNMAGQDELAIVPTNINLLAISKRMILYIFSLRTLFPRM